MSVRLVALRGPGWSYEVTPEDRLWLLRAVQAEGEPRELVARALINLFAASHTFAKHPRATLTSLVRAYAQPVNPKWANKGSEAKQARRLAATTRTTFDAAVVRAVDLALHSSFASDVTDYAAPSVDASGKYMRRSTPTAGRNTLWTRYPGWEGYGVEATEDRDTLTRAIRAVASHFDREDQAAVEEALSSLDRIGALGTEWDLETANSIDRVWQEVKTQAHDVGIKIVDALKEAGFSAKKAAELAVDTVVVRPATALAWPLTAAAVIALLIALRRRK